MKRLCRGTGGAAVGIGLVAAGFSLACLQAVAQDLKPDTTQMVFDCMKMSNADGELNLLFWIPEEFWRKSVALMAESLSGGYRWVLCFPSKSAQFVVRY